MHIIIAPNAFKNALGAVDAADAIAEGLHQSQLKCTTTCFPIADGGDGTGPLIIQKCKGHMIEKQVHDPLGRTITSCFGLIDKGKTAVIEMADASGLRLLKKEELDPMQASSAGMGQLISAALDEGVDKILVAMGGSATVDGGCGALSTLGIKFYDEEGNQLTANPTGLEKVARINTFGLDNRLANCEIVILCDVNNQLLGAQGSAEVFGPQKGATPETVRKLDAFLSRLDAVAQKECGKSMSGLMYGGTAGGAAAGLAVFLNAKLVNGIAYFLEVTGFADELAKADLVITGEGSVDNQTLGGKGPFGVAKAAKERGLPVIGLAGKVPLEPDDDLNKYFDILMAIGNGVADLSEALANTRQNLIRTARGIGDLLTIRSLL